MTLKQIVLSDDARLTADGAANVGTVRTLGTGALQAAAGSHGHGSDYAAVAHGHNILTVGEECLSRDIGLASAVLLTSGSLYLTYFTATKTEDITGLEYIGTVIAGATPSLIRFGFFTAAADGSATLVRSTAHDATIFSVANTAYARAFSDGSYSKVAGQRYAAGLLVVSAAAMPTVCCNAVAGSTTFMRTAHGRSPYVSCEVTGQTNLANVAAGVQGGIRRLYARAY